MSCITGLVLTFGGGIFTSDVAVLSALRKAAPLVALTQFSLPLTTTIDVRNIPIITTFSPADSSVSPLALSNTTRVRWLPRRILDGLFV